jgi:type IV pilus assembly protein PilM
MTLAASLKEQIDDLLLKINPGTIFGIDIGAHSIKVCELSGTPGKFIVQKFGVFNLSDAVLIEDEVQKPQEIIDGLLEAIQLAGIKSRTCCLGLYGPNTMTKRLSIPDGTKEEIEDHVMWESEQYITFGAEESQIDFDILGENEGGGSDALVVAAKNDLIERFSELIVEAKLVIKVIDLNVIALSNVFEEVMKKDIEEYDQGTLLIDFGAQSTKIVVYKRGGPIFTKEIAIGGGLITEEIQRQMGVSYEEAEDLKTSNELPQEILNIINAQLDQQMAEVKKNINFYVAQGSAEKVNYCFITGGSSLLPGLVERLNEVTGIDVQRLDVLNKVKFNAKNSLEMDRIGAIAPVVIGLAMRKVQ